MINKNKPSLRSALLIALIPIVMMYKVPVLGLGVSTVCILVSSLFCEIVLLSKCRALKLKYITYPVIFLLYFALRNSGSITSLIGYSMVSIHLLAFSVGDINFEKLRKYIITFSIIASVGIVFQYVTYYVLGFHTPMIISDLCLDELSYYKQAINTGFSRNAIRYGQTLYRPSAFFLEPAHFAQYASVGLSLCLFNSEKYVKKAFLITIGIILTTSGIGIAIVVCIWGYYIVNKMWASGIVKKIRIFLTFIIIISIAILILSQFSFFRIAISRVFNNYDSPSTSYNAIWGRIIWWDVYIKPLSGIKLIFGNGYIALDEGVFFTGIMYLLYTSGLIGVLLFIIAILTSFRIKSAEVSCMALCFAGFMMIADVNGFLWMLFFFGCIAAAELRKRIVSYDRRMGN